MFLKHVFLPQSKITYFWKYNSFFLGERWLQQNLDSTYLLCTCVLSRVWLFVTPWTISCQDPLSMEFSRREYLSELPFPPPGDLPNSGTEFASPELTYGFFTAEPPKRPQLTPKSVQIKVLWVANRDFTKLKLDQNSFELQDSVIREPNRIVSTQTVAIVFQLLSCIWLLATPWIAACHAPPTSIISWSLLRFMSIESVMLSNHIILCCPLLLLPSIFSSIWVFSNEWALRISWPKYWSFNFSISPSNKYSLFISLGIDWFDLPAVQRTVVFSSTTIQKHRFFSTLSSLWPNSHIHTWLLEKLSFSLYGSLSAKWCLCFLICCLGLSSFFPRSKCLLISWLQSLSIVILEPKEIKSVTTSTFSPSIGHEVMGLDTVILVF